jgi:16S rRNA C1402 N4-methylase RsmH
MQDLSFTKRDSEKMEEIVKEYVEKVLAYADASDIMECQRTKKEFAFTVKLMEFIEKTMASKIETMNDCDLYEIAKSLGFKLED